MYTLIFAIVVMMIALLVEPANFGFVVDPEAQLVAGTIVVAVLLLDDVFAGVVLGLAVFTMYMRVYMNKYGIKMDTESIAQLVTGTPGNKRSNKSQYPMRSLLTDYITPANLRDAQNNIYDDTNYAKEMIGVRGVYGEPVYGAQGTGEFVPGYDPYAPGSMVVPGPKK